MLDYGYEVKKRNDNYQGWMLVLKHDSGYGSGLGSANRIDFEAFVNRYAKWVILLARIFFNLQMLLEKLDKPKAAIKY